MAPVAGLLTPSYYEPHITSSFGAYASPPYSQSTTTHYGTLALDTSTSPTDRSAWNNTMDLFGSVGHNNGFDQLQPSPPMTPASSFNATGNSPLNTFQQGSITQPYPTTRQFENELVATHDDAAPLSAHSSGAVTTGNDKRNLKRHIHSPVSAFRCQHKGCSYSAASNKDLKRHLQSRKHRNAENTTEESATETYRCLAPGCKFAEEGCYRLDNLMRHIKTVHYRRGSPAEEGKSVIVTYSVTGD
ncbi:hypothetical protein B0T22DRAFT_491127 [Podospora appendiculata]|uniref:C2H2-type domain-containing protein n=1 Tax=Podospora appendiculata TaxID=314037 RepID=A0AAE1CDL5_9PEZI|nr:hypothetical protein B0T22DRAFT_491127 [Podospora appendiculata]